MGRLQDLPLAVFSAKPKCDAAIAEARPANTWLQAIADDQAATRRAVEVLNATLLRGIRAARAQPIHAVLAAAPMLRPSAGWVADTQARGAGKDIPALDGLRHARVVSRGLI